MDLKCTFSSRPLEPDWPNETVELEGVIFHWVNRPFRRITNWLHNKRLIGLCKPLWMLWQVKMLLRIFSSKVKPDVIYSMRITFVVAGWLWSRITRAKFVQRYYGVWAYNAWFEQRKWLPRIMSLRECLALRIPTDLCIITNDGTGGDKLSKWVGFPRERLRFWTNGVDKSLRISDFNSAAFKERLGLPPEAFMLMTLGRLTFWKRLGLSPKEYCVVTLHRPSNVDDMAKLGEIIAAFEEIEEEMKLVFPIHPRTRDNIKGSELESRVKRMDNLLLLEPTGYLDFLCLMSNAALVLTDSGGIQEETTILGVSCVTLRKNTERPVTITEGTNQLAEITTEGIVKGYREIRNSGKNSGGCVPKFWDGKAAERIVLHIT